MSTLAKIIGTVVAIILICLSPEDLGVTLIPGLSLLAAIWGIKWKK